jgi:hypothetical protein
MSDVPARLVEIGRSFEQAYRPVLAFDGWKVAMLRYFEPFDATGLQRVERHWNTNEVFILTAGEADLIIFDGDDTPTTPYIVQMEPHVAYNVATSVWHHVIMSPDAHIVLFEREETGDATTDFAALDASTLEELGTGLRTFAVS